jgi:hypothetical protein
LTDLPALAVLGTNVLKEGTVLGLLLCCGVLLEELLQARLKRAVLQDDRRQHTTA